MRIVAIGIIYKYIAKAVVLAEREANVRARIDVESCANPSVGDLVVWVVFPVKCAVAWQSANALNSAHLIQYASCCEINVEEIERTELRTEIQT